MKVIEYLYVELVGGAVERWAEGGVVEELLDDLNLALQNAVASTVILTFRHDERMRRVVVSGDGDVLSRM